MSGSNLDPNIALNTAGLQAQQQAQANNSPVNMLGQYASTADVLTAFRQRQQSLNSTMAIGKAAQSSINPDGTVNQGKFRTLVSQDPNAAYGAQAAIGTSQDQELGAYDVNKAQLGQATTRAAVFSSALTPLLGQGNNVQPADVYGVVARLHSAGVPVDEAVDQIATTMPHQGGAVLRSWIARNVTGSGGLPTSSALPTPTVLDTGGQSTVLDANPVSNPSLPGTTFNRTLSPSEAASPVSGPPTASGAPTTVPLASYAASHGMGNLLPTTGRAPLPAGLVGPGGAPSSAPGSSAGAPSSVPGAPQSPFGGGGAWGPSSSGAAAPPNYGPPTPTGLGPGTRAALDTAGAASANQWADLQHQVGGSSAGGGSAGRIYQLKQSLGLLQKLGPQGTGPGAAGMQSLLRYTQSLPIVGGLVSGVTSPQDIANYDMANKYLTAYASARAGAHGGTTDSQLATTLSSNASTHISNLAAQDVVKANIGLERMDQAQADAFSRSGLTPDQFSNFSANWNRTQDPRAYISDQLTPKQFTSLVSGMSPADLTKFRATYNAGVANGWIDTPAWMQSGAGAGAGAGSGGGAPGPSVPNGP